MDKNTDKDRLESKGISWNEFDERIDKLFQSITNLIKDTNGTQNDR